MVLIFVIRVMSIASYIVWHLFILTVIIMYQFYKGIMNVQSAHRHKAIPIGILATT